MALVKGGRPRQDSNLRSRLRRPLLYPLSYGGGSVDTTREAYQSRRVGHRGHGESLFARQGRRLPRTFEGWRETLGECSSWTTIR